MEDLRMDTIRGAYEVSAVRDNTEVLTSRMITSNLAETIFQDLPLEDEDEIRIKAHRQSDISASADRIPVPPLHSAAASGDVERVSKVLRFAPQSIRERSCVQDGGGTALSAAAAGGHAQVIRCLLDAGSDPAAETLTGLTPLHLAADGGYADAIAALLERPIKGLVDRPTPDGHTALLLACYGGHRDAVRALISAGANAMVAAKRDGATPLHVIAEYGYTDIVELLLSAGAKANARALADKQTPLHIAARTGHVGVATVLLESRRVSSATSGTGRRPTSGDKASTTVPADVHAKTARGATPLHLACRYGHTEMARLLVRRGATVDALMTVFVTRGRVSTETDDVSDDEETTTNGEEDYEEQGWTCLHHASLWGHVHIVDFLITVGASVDAATAFGTTALYLAAQNGRGDVVRSLLRATAQVDRLTEVGSTPLIVAAGGGHRDVVELLVRHGAAVNHAARDWHRSTPLMEAIDNGHHQVVEVLLAAGADPHCQRADGYTHLYRAVLDERPEVVETLLVRGKVDPNTGLPGGMTALQLASAVGNYRLVELLLSHGADPTLARDDGSTALHEAAGFGHLPVVRHLLAAGADQSAIDTNDGSTPLHVACEERRVEVVNELLGRPGASDALKVTDRRGATPLIRAASTGDGLLVKALAVRSDPSVVDVDGWTALHHAVRAGRPETVDVLIDFVGSCGTTVRGDVNRAATGGCGDSPLCVAAVHGHDEVARLLMRRGANIDFSRAGDGATPLHLATKAGHADVTETLLTRGANINATDRNGNTPLHLAAVGGLREVIDCLLRHGADTEAVNKGGKTPGDVTKDKTVKILMKARHEKGKSSLQLSRPMSSLAIFD